ncbi:shikimate dehydrogenase family protein [Methylobacterium planeticum]|uniref:Shikimate dehydrogenase n=1 Tax=Methylobacterium planeticum TaxID=2615211 RepID=A0A6N6MPQ3_9HYPH|nr:shikimate dehydrogenase [Methylobacterium planeticum]KAB1072995.1 shikimate dehydrogenase [Methylobacterium planeticum]
MRAITGETRIYGVLADPIYHVKTPEVMHALFARHGVDGVLVPLHVRPDGLRAALDGLRTLENFGGFIATVPHKEPILDLCDALTPEARRTGAVNCVRREPDGRMVGTMLDGIGFLEALRASGLDPRGLHVGLAGAGGAACAVAFALAEAGIAHLTIRNRGVDRAAALAARLAAAFPRLSLGAGRAQPDHDLLINATSLGMRSADAAPFDLAAIHPRQFVADAIMEPEMTSLLAAAQAAGCRIQKGRPMLESQIALMARHMGAL